MLKIKRAYEAPDAGDGIRVLVDRLWPRGLTKVKAKVALWPKEISPSTALRTWYGHEPAKWAEFKRRYFKEIKGRPEIADLLGKAARGTVTLVYGSRETRYNNAEALKEYLEKLAAK